MATVDALLQADSRSAHGAARMPTTVEDIGVGRIDEQGSGRVPAPNLIPSTRILRPVEGILSRRIRHRFVWVGNSDSNGMFAIDPEITALSGYRCAFRWVGGWAHRGRARGRVNGPSPGWRMELDSRCRWTTTGSRDQEQGGQYSDRTRELHLPLPSRLLTLRGRCRDAPSGAGGGDGRITPQGHDDVIVSGVLRIPLRDY